ncbi:MAG: AraC family transcriptional regulator [Bacteroidales bacterium]|nr:AraC family transcriptional regulator [Bacteroidales bacterium]
MLNTFNRLLEVADGLQSNLVKLLYYEIDGDFNDFYKSYESLRLCTILEGEKHVCLNNKEEFTYTKDRLLILPPYSTVHMDIQKHTKALVLELNDRLISEVKLKTFTSESLEIDENKFYLGPNNGDVKNCLQRIHNIAISQDRNKQYLLDLLAQELTAYVVRESGASQIINNEINTLTSKAIMLMRENLSPPISINDIAYTLNISVPFLSKKFKNQVGISPSIFYNNLKLQEAKKLLLSKNVNETSWNLGYENVSHFIRLFTRAFGFTPLQWKIENDKVLL